MGGIAACVVCAVLSCLKGVGAEKRKFVGYLEDESWSVHECDCVERAVTNSSGRVLSSIEAQEQGTKRRLHLASRIHPEMLFGCFQLALPCLAFKCSSSATAVTQSKQQTVLSWY